MPAIRAAAASCARAQRTTIEVDDGLELAVTNDNDDCLNSCSWLVPTAHGVNGIGC